MLHVGHKHVGSSYIDAFYAVYADVNLTLPAKACRHSLVERVSLWGGRVGVCGGVPDQDDVDFSGGIFDEGGGVLVTPPVQDLTVDLLHNSHC